MHITNYIGFIFFITILFPAMRTIRPDYPITSTAHMSSPLSNIGNFPTVLAFDMIFIMLPTLGKFSDGDVIRIGTSR